MDLQWPTYSTMWPTSSYYNICQQLLSDTKRLKKLEKKLLKIIQLQNLLIISCGDAVILQQQQQQQKERGHKDAAGTLKDAANLKCTLNICL